MKEEEKSEKVGNSAEIVELELDKTDSEAVQTVKRTHL